MTSSQAEHIPVVRICFLRQAALIYSEESSGVPAFEPSTPTAVGIDLRACFSEAEFSLPPGNRLPDARTSAGNQRHLVFKPHHATGFPPLTSIRVPQI